MNKIITLILCLCCVFTTAWADDAPALNPSDANIVGHILDKKTGEHLSFINVFLKGTTIGTSTDATGHYYLKNLPEGKYTLVMKTLGFKTVEKPITLKKGKTLEINFEAEEDLVSLDGVVVSANRNETTRRLAPSLVNVLDSKTFETTHATSLADGLNFQPGVRVENNCQNCGFQQVRINGLEGPYTQILVDSRPIFSALTGVYGLEQIPANMIERVEIMRGGGSALFGSSAIAGTINIITKEPLRNSAQISHSLTMIGGDRPDNNTTINASLVTDDHKAGIYMFGQNRYRGAYDHDGDGYTELGKLNARTLGFRSYLKTSMYSKLTFEYHNINEYRRGGNLLDLPPHEADIAEQTEHNINGGGLKFDLFSKDYKHRLNVYTSAQHTKRNSYYGADKNPNAYGSTTDMTFVGGAQYSYEWEKCLFMPAEFTGGGPVQTNFLVEGFYTDLRNVFILEEIGRDKDNNLLMERRNGKGARVMGINLEAKAVYSWMQIQAGATIQRSRYKEPESWSENENLAPQKKMFRSPDVYGYFTSSFTPVKRLTASLTGTYTGSMLVQHLAGYIPEDREEKTKDFFDLNVKVAYDFPLYKSVTLQVNAGVQNIFNSYQDDFDKYEKRDAGYIYGPGIPRSYFIGCKISY